MIFGEAGATQEPKLLSLSFGTGQLWSSQTLLISVAQTVVYLLFMLHVQHGSGVVGGGAGSHAPFQLVSLESNRAPETCQGLLTRKKHRGSSL